MRALTPNDLRLIGSEAWRNSGDPVEGGSSNDYAYVFGDPVNAYDLKGSSTFCGVAGSSPGRRLSATRQSKGVPRGIANQVVSNGSTTATKAALQRAAKASSGLLSRGLSGAAKFVGRSSTLPAQGVLGIIHAGCIAERNYRESRRWKEGMTVDVPRPQDFNGSGIPQCNGGVCFP